ncbi:MAG TPA: 23S rRNA (pseudouridine(1915)-N(3))-methyltransferase RlmH, partial [Bacteroidetes bacterium]|nr:23S rRNA (pseudouridine(1915)-N(3))-methyltransferase RlmH [Bacteroidota bacterium]
QAVSDRSDGKWSLSSLTFPHHMVRTVFLEQLYRGFTLLKGEKYHND